MGDRQEQEYQFWLGTRLREGQLVFRAVSGARLVLGGLPGELLLHLLAKILNPAETSVIYLECPDVRYVGSNN